eukprot:TRINITY_DN5429_c0_g1_i1.p1 TRINITY_DN5429_c0_g1~~TRINITY_DN5429_c0_g1_i1.p1  ORF type:complete len:586 (-),score=159.37 TRINITY_DN5429_c0_g1_i1:32-1789(-)
MQKSATQNIPKSQDAQQHVSNSPLPSGSQQTATQHKGATQNTSEEKSAGELASENSELEHILSLKNEESDLLRARMKKLEEVIATLSNNNKELHLKNSNLESKMTAILLETSEEKRSRMLADVDEATKNLDQELFMLDNPNNTGNTSTNQEQVTLVCKKLIGNIESLVSAVKGGKESVLRDAIHKLVATSQDVLFDAKGFSSLIDDAKTKENLLDKTRQSVGITLELVHKVGGNIGELDDWTDTTELTKHSQESVQRISALIQALGSVGQNSNTDNSVVAAELESKATEDLLQAAKMIEESVALLNQARNKPLPKKPEGEVDLRNEIMESASGIANAAAKLVSAATEAQKMREKQGKLPKSPENQYKPDPSWTEGLTSAAKHVAHVTKELVTAANDTVSGRVDESMLIATSRGVTAATARLVAASRAKASPFSETQSKVEEASSMVRKASNALVSTAKAASSPQAQEGQSVNHEIDKSEVEHLRAVTEQRHAILRTEDMLRKEQEKLKQLQKQKYDSDKNRKSLPASLHKPVPNTQPKQVPQPPKSKENVVTVKLEDVESRRSLDPKALKKEEDRINKMMLKKGW